MARFLLGMALIVAMVAWVPAAAPDAAEEGNRRVRAKIGIQIRTGDRTHPARSLDRIAAGDLLRIYVHPENPAFVYVIHSDGATATLLNEVAQKQSGATLVMPSLTEYYQVDGASPIESFTVICSPERLAVLAPFEEGATMSHSRWEEIESKLSERGRLDLQESAPIPFAIAGNVRGAASAVGDDRFTDELMIFTGEGLLLKRYAFSIAK